MRKEQAAIRWLDNAAHVSAGLSPIRREILGRLAEPGSATALAAQLDLTRQKVNYHLHELEKSGLVEKVEVRQRRGFMEGVYRASAGTFVVDPALLGSLGTVRDQDRFSSAWLLRVAARLLRDVGLLRERAAGAGKKLLTQTIETEVRFRTPGDFEAFSEDLVREIARLAAKHGARKSDSARRFRFVVMGHPSRAKKEEES